MTKYTTVEGHEIKVGETYEIRNGNKVKVLAFNELDDEFPVVGCFVPDGDIDNWTANGVYLRGKYEFNNDLMRPWKEESPITPESKPAQKIPTFIEAVVSGELGEHTFKTENTDVFKALFNYTSDYLEKYMANKE